jgi:hypothetical protein
MTDMKSEVGEDGKPNELSQAADATDSSTDAFNPRTPSRIRQIRIRHNCQRAKDDIDITRRQEEYSRMEVIVRE